MTVHHILYVSEINQILAVSIEQSIEGDDGIPKFSSTILALPDHKPHLPLLRCLDGCRHQLGISRTEYTVRAYSRCVERIVTGLQSHLWTDRHVVGIGQDSGSLGTGRETDLFLYGFSLGVIVQRFSSVWKVFSGVLNINAFVQNRSTTSQD